MNTKRFRAEDECTPLHAETETRQPSGSTARSMSASSRQICRPESSKGSLNPKPRRNPTADYADRTDKRRECISLFPVRVICAIRGFGPSWLTYVFALNNPVSATFLFAGNCLSDSAARVTLPRWQKRAIQKAGRSRPGSWGRTAMRKTKGGYQVVLNSPSSKLPPNNPPPPPDPPDPNAPLPPELPLKAF